MRKKSLPLVLSIVFHLLLFLPCLLLFMKKTDQPEKWIGLDLIKSEVEIGVHKSSNVITPRKKASENRSEFSPSSESLDSKKPVPLEMTSVPQNKSPGSSVEGSPDRSSETSRYLAEIRQRIENQLDFFESLQRKGLKGRVILRVMLHPSGALSSAEILQSSGSTELDQAALQSIQGAAPFPPFEKRLGSRSLLRFQLPLIFE